jgi:hypothetical protein
VVTESPCTNHSGPCFACLTRSSCRHLRSILPTIADYAAGMAKVRFRKPDGGRKSKPAANAGYEILLTAESDLPPTKPSAPSVKRRLKLGRKAKLMK